MGYINAQLRIRTLRKKPGFGSNRREKKPGSDPTLKKTLQSDRNRDPVSDSYMQNFIIRNSKIFLLIISTIKMILPCNSTQAEIIHPEKKNLILDIIEIFNRCAHELFNSSGAFILGNKRASSVLQFHGHTPNTTAATLLQLCCRLHDYKNRNPDPQSSIWI